MFCLPLSYVSDRNVCQESDPLLPATFFTGCLKPIHIHPLVKSPVAILLHMREVSRVFGLPSYSPEHSGFTSHFQFDCQQDPL